MKVCINHLVKKYNIRLLLLATVLCCGVAHGQSSTLRGPNDLVRPSSTKGGLKGPQTIAPELVGVRHGPINNDDTLWNIAKTYRPSPAVNMIQMMVRLLIRMPLIVTLRWKNCMPIGKSHLFIKI